MSLSLLRAALASLPVVAATALAGCKWSVPADPGENVRQRGASIGAPERPAGALARGPGSPSAGATAADDGARTMYLQRCAQCHEPFPPQHAAPGEWPGIVRKYGPRAGLFGQDRERVVHWL